MNSRVLLIVGLLTTLLYVMFVLFINSLSVEETHLDSKFFLNIKDRKADLVLKLPATEKDSFLAKTAGSFCDRLDCSKSEKFEAGLDGLICSSVVEKLVRYISENNLTKASVVATSKEVEINFLVKSADELEKLQKLYGSCKVLKDNSSVLEVFDISHIESELNGVLRDLDLDDERETIDFKNRRILNRVFRRLRELGQSNVVLNLNANNSKLERLKSFIKDSYPWIESITIMKTEDKNKIEIKGVLG